VTLLVYLHVSFTVDAHQIEAYETIYGTEFMPVLRDLGFEAVGIWKTLVGRAGEFMEIWRFSDAADFEAKWNGMMADPRVAAIMQKTGPLVHNESFKLMTEATFGRLTGDE
jgi:hypothetical protein